MISTKALVGLSDFTSSCEEFTSGKFIFAINKITKILKSISNCNELYDLFAECLKDFNYSKELSHAKQKLPTKKGEFIIPQDDKTLIALVFCMLVDIEEGKIDLKALVDDYFYDGEHDEFVNFANALILPFKNAVVNYFNTEKPQEKPEENQLIADEEPHDDNEPNYHVAEARQDVFTEISGICDIIIDNMLIMNKKDPEIKEDCLFIAGKIKDACYKNDVNEVCTLTVAIKYILANYRKLRFLSKELAECTLKFYE